MRQTGMLAYPTEPVGNENTMFDDGRVADIYDAMIDWPKRLAHEGPFYRRLFQRIDCPPRARRGLRHGPARGACSTAGASRSRGPTSARR